MVNCSIKNCKQEDLRVLAFTAVFLYSLLPEQSVLFPNHIFLLTLFWDFNIAICLSSALPTLQSEQIWCFAAAVEISNGVKWMEGKPQCSLLLLESLHSWTQMLGHVCQPKYITKRVHGIIYPLRFTPTLVLDLLV